MATNAFSAYEKMPTSLKKLGLSERDFSQMEKLDWVVTEKVHGANFSFIYANGFLSFAKRKELLAWQDDFFGFQLVVVKLEQQMIRLFEDLSHQIPSSRIIVYGELFGGEYPHPQVPAVSKVKAIQTGVYYSPGIHFYAFDIAIEKKGSSKKVYLKYRSAVRLFEKYEILHARPLFVGKLGEAMSFNTIINSNIPRELKLPELSENLIEGIVIKPYNMNSEVFEFSRPILKLKNKEFEEDKSFHEAQKWSYVPKVNSKMEDLSYILKDLRNYLTQNRLNSAISKVGALDSENVERIKEIENELLSDSMIDFGEDNKEILEELHNDEVDWIRERLRNEIVTMIRAMNDE